MEENDQMVLLPDDQDLVVEWDMRQVVALVRLIDHAGLNAELNSTLAEDIATAVLSVKFANRVKQFLFDHGLHQREAAAADILLSAHCQCDGKTPKP